jgi:hypothetical protein
METMPLSSRKETFFAVLAGAVRTTIDRSALVAPQLAIIPAVAPSGAFAQSMPIQTRCSSRFGPRLPERWLTVIQGALGFSVHLAATGPVTKKSR